MLKGMWVALHSIIIIWFYVYLLMSLITVYQTRRFFPNICTLFVSHDLSFGSFTIFFKVLSYVKKHVSLNIIFER